MNDIKTIYNAISNKTAQQDYKIIAPTPGRSFSNDAAALGELKKAILNRTAFDCLVKDTTPGENDLCRVLGYHPDASDAVFYSIGVSEIKEIALGYSVTQYQGLAAVQAEIDRIDAVGEAFPAFAAVNGLLEETTSGYLVCTHEGYQYRVTLSDNKIVTIEVSTTKVEGHLDFIAISNEDAQKLIGLHCD